MPKYAETYIICWQCRGTGLKPSSVGSTETCSYCQGTGRIHYGHLDVTDLVDKLNDIMDKCNDIFEKLS